MAYTFLQIKVGKMFILSVAALGVLGVFFRYFGINFINSIFTPSTTMNTGLLFVNVLGSFLIGVVFVLKTKVLVTNEWLWLAIVVGFLGAFTTFSSYSLEVIKALLSKQYALAAASLFLHNFLALLFCFLGYWVATKVVA